jgi:arylsulfatase A-like enzyme
MGCAGNSDIRTPNLDRLAATGLRFDNFFCASPVCSPARASILTGLMPSRHGVHDWLRGGNMRGDLALGGQPIEYLAGLTGYTDVLAANGYACGLSGKWHLGDSHHAQKGFTFWEAHATGGGPYYGASMIRDGEIVQEPRYVTDVITDNALRFLETRMAEPQPFCLNVHYTAPHSPWDRKNHPAELYDAYHRDCPFGSTPDLPPHPWQINSAPLGADPARRRAELSGYYAAITAMDANIGRILDALERGGRRNDTLVLFTSDNGMNMGHHGLYGKGNATFPMNMYDTSVKVPMLASMPGLTPQGCVNDELLSHYDLMPTLLDLAGLPTPNAASLPGRSFAGLLRGEVSAGCGFVVVLDEYGPVRMIRDRHSKYVHRYPYGPHEFYDLDADPGEMRNLIADPAHARRIETLKAELETWFHRHTDPARDGVREPVTGKGQLGPCGPAAEGRKVQADDWNYTADGARDYGRAFRPPD